ncbi:MAG: hypothetical protein K9L31_01670, partial [Candidatus Pacebacteria bacterium]|nr:hypothetical protein [Candidatus Paceibacterota bacterium]
AFSGGTVDGNSITEFCSSGNFDDYQARMTVEGDKEKVFLNITVVKKVPDIFTMLIGMETSEQMKIATKIEDRMIKMGYVVDPRYK